MHWQRENKKIINYYSGLLKEHGNDPRAVDWGSSATQENRFSVLSEVGNFDGSSLLDVGCGLADLYDYLKRRKVDVDYTGFDITRAMIDRARQRFPKIKLEIRDLISDSTPSLKFDYVLASGIFYLRQAEPMVYLENMVRRMFAMCRRAVAFNTLSIKSSKRSPGEFYADPSQVLTMCLGITQRVILRHDYLPNDFTVYMYRDKK